MIHSAIVSWQRSPEEQFTDNQYSRVHQWAFDGGVRLQASASPHIVPQPLSDAAFIDPEEAFVAALASCHLLFFLSIAAGKGYLIESYEDNAEGVMDKDGNGRMAMVEVSLRPRVRFGGTVLPGKEIIENLHHEAHRKCFLANSVKTKITIDPQF